MEILTMLISGLMDILPIIITFIIGFFYGCRKRESSNIELIIVVEIIIIVLLLLGVIGQ